MKGFFLTAALIMAILISCNSAPKTSRIKAPVTLPVNENTINELTGRVWRLAEVSIDNVNIGFSRSDLPRISITAAGSFTLSFDEETISGVGAPNRYIAPYKRTDNQISISMMATTKRAPISKLDKINEQEYFIYLQNASGWNLNNNRLVLNSKTADGKVVVLIFWL
jgi:heat shock protein HslJ